MFDKKDIELPSWLGERTAMAIDTIIQDGRGWETAHPLPFDEKYQPKHAYYAIRDFK